jgi:hypothetical protein
VSVSPRLRLQAELAQCGSVHYDIGLSAVTRVGHGNGGGGWRCEFFCNLLRNKHGAHKDQVKDHICAGAGNGSPAPLPDNFFCTRDCQYPHGAATVRYLRRAIARLDAPLRRGAASRTPSTKATSASPPEWLSSQSRAQPVSLMTDDSIWIRRKSCQPSWRVNHCTLHRLACFTVAAGRWFYTVRAPWRQVTPCVLRRQ